ncbi:MAG: hypothetical protein KA714_30625 [Limnoraphis sp. WC205]|jgi:hypothetical protein|nr:hypothetical protein [Limnoraphis sp. WC205]
MNYSEIYGAALHHNAIAISKEPRKSSHSYTGFCTDVFFDNPDNMNQFISIVELIVEKFLAVSYEEDWARVRVPCIVK